MPVFADGFAAAEAEFLLRVGTPPPADQKRFTTEEATAHIDMVHLGIEIASSPLPTINDLGPTVTISDFGNNNGLVIGPAIADWRGADIADWPVSLLINGREAGRAEEHTSELQSVMRTWYAGACWKKKNEKHEH